MRLAFGVVFFLSASAWACDRSPSPFELDLATALAVSDVVFVAKVKEVSESSALVEVVQPLRGTLTRSLVELGGLGPTRLLELCAGTPLIVGKDVIVFGWAAPGDAKVFVIDPFGGLRPNSPEWREKVKATPPAAMSPWSGTGSIRTRLFTAPPSKGSKELDLRVVLRNVGNTSATFEYSDWPEQTASTCRVNLTNAEGIAVAGKPVPIARADIEAYFSKHGRRYSLPVAAGRAHVHSLARVTTAAQGWGYKEELGFTYWPVTTKGRFQASVSCKNFFGPGSTVEAGPLAVDL